MIANAFLEAEIDRLSAAVSSGFARGKVRNMARPRKLPLATLRSVSASSCRFKISTLTINIGGRADAEAGTPSLPTRRNEPFMIARDIVRNVT